MRVPQGLRALPFPLSSILSSLPATTTTTFLAGCQWYERSHFPSGHLAGPVGARVHCEGAVRRQRPQSEIQGTAELP